MGVRTYLPMLLAIAKTLCNYIRRYETQIKSRLTPDGQAALDGVLTACELLETFIPVVTPTE